MPLLGSMCRNTFYPLELASVSFKQRDLCKSDILPTWAFLEMCPGMCFWATEIGVFLSKVQWNIYNHAKQKPTNQHNQQPINNHIYLIYILNHTHIHLECYIDISLNWSPTLSTLAADHMCPLPLRCSLKPRDRKTEMMLWYGKGNGVIATSVGRRKECLVKPLENKKAPNKKRDIKKFRKYFPISLWS